MIDQVHLNKFSSGCTRLKQQLYKWPWNKQQYLVHWYIVSQSLYENKWALCLNHKQLKYLKPTPTYFSKQILYYNISEDSSYSAILFPEEVYIKYIICIVNYKVNQFLAISIIEIAV